MNLRSLFGLQDTKKDKKQTEEEPVAESKAEAQKKFEEALNFARVTVNADDSTQGRYLKLLVPYTNSENDTKVYEKLTEDQLLGKKPPDLADIMVRNDPTADKVVDDLIIHGVAGYDFSCDDPAGDEVLREFFALLERKRNSFRMSLVKMFTSIMTRGEVCIEITFDEEGKPSNFFVVDPQYIKFQEEEHPDYPNDGPIWVLGQMHGDSFTPIHDPTVAFESVNPMLKTPRGRSVIASSFTSLISDALMLHDLRKVIKNHAWIQRFIALNHIAMKEAEYTTDEIKEFIEASINKIENEWKDLPPEDTPVGTGEIEFRQYEGAGAPGGSRLQFVDTVDRVLDRKSIRGTKEPPALLGSNEFVAESSFDGQAMQYSMRVGSHQDTVIRAVEPLLKLGIRSQGIAGNVNFQLKRVNAAERKREAEVFQAMMLGLTAAIGAGMPLPIAIKLYEKVTDFKFDRELIEEIEAAVEAEREAQNSGTESDLDTTVPGAGESDS